MNARVNGVPVDVAAAPTVEFAAVHELLVQRVRDLGWIDAGAERAEVDDAIECLLAREVPVPEPSEEECRRWYDANAGRFRSGDLACVRHILFQVTPGAAVPPLRDKAESVLRELRRDPQRFAALAKQYSNCPSGASGGQLGQLQRGQTVPEFEKAVFDGPSTGILPRLVTTRYGFHVVAVDQRIQGRQLEYAQVRDQVRKRLYRHCEQCALHEYVQLLAGHADIEGVQLGAATSPLVQ